jgi:ParB-like chromosome segregation protein Spo0J
MKFPLHMIEESMNPLRAMQPAKVDALVESMAKIGLREPITIRSIRSVRDGKPVDAWQIVAGRHRVAAARRLEWTEIDAGVIEDESEARLWEIAENLHRADLTVLERAEHVAEWVRLTDEKPDQVGQVSAQLGEKPRVGRPEGGISLAARQLPVAGDTEKAKRHNVERAIKVDGIAPEAKAAAREAGIADNQSALLKVARETSAAAQAEKVSELANERAARRLPCSPTAAKQSLMTLPAALALLHQAEGWDAEELEANGGMDYMVAKEISAALFALELYRHESADKHTALFAVMGGDAYVRAVFAWREEMEAWRRKRTRRGDVPVPPAIPSV